MEAMMTTKRELVQAAMYLGTRHSELGDLLIKTPFEVGKRYQEVREALNQLRRMIDAIVEEPTDD